MKPYKFLSHTADIKFQAFGKNIEECFKNSAYALKEIISGKARIKPRIKKTIKIKGRDNESLLYNFLEEFLFLLDSRGFVLGKISLIKINKKRFGLNAVIYGDNAKNYNFSNPVKAITYNNMFLKTEKTKYTAQIVLDV
jgi:SHS2 domain-containing protein